MEINGSTIYICLVHFPVYNKNMEIVTTSVTNLDLHDISRSATTYNIDKFYVVHPAPGHQKVINNIIHYWFQGYGSQYNPDRKTAFSKIALRDSLEQVIAELEAMHGKVPKIITTDARIYADSISYLQLRREMVGSKEVYLILFGTGWGLEKKVMESADYILEPIQGTSSYNHLSVRAAAAIILDRLLGKPWWES